MKREFQYPSRDGVTQIHAIEWEPEGEIHAVMPVMSWYGRIYRPI